MTSPTTEARGPFTPVAAIQLRRSTNAAFVEVVVRDEAGQHYSYVTSCLYFYLKPCSAPEPAEIDEGKLWSFLRSVLVKGDDISTDHQGSYELYSAQMDAAARDLVPALLKIIGRQPETKGEQHGS